LQLICCRLPRGAGVLPTLATASFQTLAAAASFATCAITASRRRTAQLKPRPPSFHSYNLRSARGRDSSSTRNRENSSPDHPPYTCKISMLNLTWFDVHILNKIEFILKFRLLVWDHLVYRCEYFSITFRYIFGGIFTIFPEDAWPSMKLWECPSIFVLETST
jgi:hypothetical protein